MTNKELTTAELIAAAREHARRKASLREFLPKEMLFRDIAEYIFEHGTETQKAQFAFSLPSGGFHSKISG